MRDGFLAAGRPIVRHDLLGVASRLRVSAALLVGPSGAGKTTIGEWAQEDLGLLWLEADVWGADGINGLRLRHQWDAFFYDGEPHRLANTLRLRAKRLRRAGAILTLSSTVLLSPAQVESARAVGLTVAVAWGAAEACLGALMAREEKLQRGIGENHWRQYNRECLWEYGRSVYADIRLETFNHNGSRRARTGIMADLAVLLT